MPDTIRWLKYQVEEEGHVRTYRVDFPQGTLSAVIGVEAKVKAGNWMPAPGPEPVLTASEAPQAVAVPSEEVAVLAGGMQRAAMPVSAEAVPASAVQEFDALELGSRTAVRDVCYYQGGHWYCWGRE